jgi:hypothetical protein
MPKPDILIKAEDLIKDQYERNKRKQDTFNKIYKNIENKIKIASIGNNYYTVYEIPEFILGIPLYCTKDAIIYLKKKLVENGFYVEHFEPNILLINWLPKK